MRKTARPRIDWQIIEGSSFMTVKLPSRRSGLSRAKNERLGVGTGTGLGLGDGVGLGEATGLGQGVGTGEAGTTAATVVFGEVFGLGLGDGFGAAACIV